MEKGRTFPSDMTISIPFPKYFPKVFQTVLLFPRTSGLPIQGEKVRLLHTERKKGTGQ